MRLPDRHKQISGEEKILKLLGQNQRLYPRGWEVESWASLWPKDNTTTCTGSRARSTGLPPPPRGALSLLAVFPLPYWLLASCPLQPPVPFTLPPSPPRPRWCVPMPHISISLCLKIWTTIMYNYLHSKGASPSS